MPISFLLWPGERFLCSCRKAGDFPFCRGGWWTHLWDAEVLLPHPTFTAEKVCHPLQQCVTTMLVYFDRDGICDWVFSRAPFLAPSSWRGDNPKEGCLDTQGAAESHYCFDLVKKRPYGLSRLAVCRSVACGCSVNATALAGSPFPRRHRTFMSPLGLKVMVE